MPSWVREEEAILKPWVCWWWTSACSSSVIFWLDRYLSDGVSFLEVLTLHLSGGEGLLVRGGAVKCHKLASK